MEYRVSVIIPFNRDRGWLADAVNSVPKYCQLILSKGDGNWPQNFNKALPMVEGEYIKWLHEDDMLTPNSIADSVACLDDTGADFIHGDAIEIKEGRVGQRIYKPPITIPNVQDLLFRNSLHSSTMMYRKSVFDRLGGLDESPDIDALEEYEFNLRCLKAGLKIAYCPHTLSIYRRHPQQKIRIATATSLDRYEKNKRREQLKAKFV